MSAPINHVTGARIRFVMHSSKTTQCEHTVVASGCLEESKEGWESIALSARTETRMCTALVPSPAAEARLES